MQDARSKLAGIFGSGPLNASAAPLPRLVRQSGSNEGLSGVAAKVQAVMRDEGFTSEEIDAIMSGKKDLFGLRESPAAVTSVVDLTDYEADDEAEKVWGADILPHPKTVAKRSAPKKRETQVVKWVCTVYPHRFDDVADCKRVLDLIGEDSEYAMFGLEICPKTKRPHLQGFCVLKEKARSTQMQKRYHPSIHWEHMMGTIEDSEVYCSKEDKSPLVYGSKPVDPGQLEKNRWEAARQNAKGGNYDDIDAQIFVMYFNSLQRIGNHYAAAPPTMDDVCGVWLYGVAGAGKTTYATTKYGAYYDKLPNKWWDGYQGEKVVLCDDVDPSMDYLAPFIKRWCDKFPFRAEMKGSGGFFRPETMIFTSNFSLEECFGKRSDFAAIKRRFREVVYFPFKYGKGEPVVQRSGTIPLYEEVETISERAPDTVRDPPVMVGPGGAVYVEDNGVLKTFSQGKFHEVEDRDVLAEIRGMYELRRENAIKRARVEAEDEEAEMEIIQKRVGLEDVEMGE